MVLSTAAFEFNYFIWKNVLGTGKNLDYLQTKPAPSIFAIRVRLGGLKRSNWVLSYLTRHDFELNLEGRRSLNNTEIGATERSFDEIRFHQRVSENWAGITWAYKYNARISLGISQFIILRNQRNRSQNLGQIIYPDSSGESQVYINEFYYWSTRTFWKMGVLLDYSPLTVGVTISTPGIHILGSGWTFVAISEILPPSVSGSRMLSDYQEGLKAHYKSSWAVSFGMSYRLNNTQLHFSGEWFQKIPAYRVLTGGNMTTVPISKVIHEAKSVFNWGVAAENRLSERLTLYGGFTVDRSFTVPGGKSNLSFTSWDVYHLSIGSAFFVWKSYFTLGVSYSFGGDQITPSSFYLKNRGLSFGEIKSRRLKVLLGLSLRF